MVQLGLHQAKTHYDPSSLASGGSSPLGIVRASLDYVSEELEYPVTHGEKTLDILLS